MLAETSALPRTWSHIISTTLHPHPQHRPRLHEPHGHQKPHARRNRHPGKKLRVQIPPVPPLHQHPSDRRPRQHRETQTTHHHPHPDARLLQILRQARQHGGEQTQHAGAEEAVDDGKGDEAGFVDDGDPDEDEQGGDGGEGDHGVQGAEVAVGDVVGDETAGDAAAVEDEEEGDGGVGR